MRPDDIELGQEGKDKLKVWRLARWRRDLVSPLRGRVLEICCGDGPSFRHYHPSCEVIAMDLDAESCRLAEFAANRCAAAVEVRQADVQELPFPDQHFDAALSCLALCSVGSLERTLAEIKRVLKPEGVLAMLEHVLPTSRGGAWLAHAVQPWWARRFLGCQTTRNTAGVLIASGWRVLEYARTYCVVRGVFSPDQPISARRFSVGPSG